MLLWRKLKKEVGTNMNKKKYNVGTQKWYNLCQPNYEFYFVTVHWFTFEANKNAMGEGCCVDK